MAAPSAVPPATARFPAVLAARRFPLVSRPRTGCRPLAQRLDQVARLASQPHHADYQTLLHAAEACNLAALIASDCAMPDLARDLCWAQFTAYCTAGPYPEATAKLALQPLVNLARLRTRDGNGDAAYQILESLYHAARAPGSPATVDDRPVSLAAIIAPGDDHKAITQWLWTILLSDGLRALCRAGRWTIAQRHAEQHDGIGNRLLDGRQITILASIASGQHDNATDAIRRTIITDPWEHVVAACLHAVNATTSGQEGELSLTRMINAYLALGNPGHAMFAARLGLTVAELCGDNDARPEVTDKIRHLATHADAYTAREILASTVADRLPPDTVATLHATVSQASLGQPLSSAETQHLTDYVTSAVMTMTAPLAAALTCPACILDR